MASRREIREATVELLLGQTAAGTRVSSSRARPSWSEGLPAILVYTPREDWEVSVDSPREYRVRTDVAVELLVEKSAAGVPDELLDELADQVFAVLSKNPTLDLDGLTIVPVSSASDFAEGAKRPLGGERFLWRATHYREAPEEEPGELGIFETAHIEHDLAPPDGTLEALDDVHPDQ